MIKGRIGFAMAGRFRRHQGGATAVEFALVGSIFTALLMGILQFGLYFVASIQMRSVVAETVAYASVFSNTALFPETRDPVRIRESICKEMLLVTNCLGTLKVEQMPLASLSAAEQPITGVQFSTGVAGDVLVRRAEVGVVTFVPGMSALKVRTSSIFLRR